MSWSMSWSLNLQIKERNFSCLIKVTLIYNVTLLIYQSESIYIEVQLL